MSDFTKLGDGQAADVTLVLEGTYPFVSGGVSSWVHQIVSGTPELAFALVFIGGSPEIYGELRYSLPKNVVHLECHYLNQPAREQRLFPMPGSSVFQERSSALHDAMRALDPEAVSSALESVLETLLVNPRNCERDFLSSERSYAQICDGYLRLARDQPFLDFFWTIRSMHAPIFQLTRVLGGLPVTRAVHVISTGFAGFLGAMLSRARNCPLILTEHGIYTKERRIELLEATWLGDADTGQATIGTLRQLWIRFFEMLGRITYAAATPIISLFAANRRRQITDGAEPSRTLVVPNGIAVDRWSRLRSRAAPSERPVLGLIGRVVPIKDIKTFIRAVRAARALLPEIEGWVVGPEDEDPAYAAECRDLAASLQLGASFKFLGFQRIDEIFPQLSLNILTSISEAQPLVVLEGFAAGVPCIATDVGCCRELIFGQSGEDEQLGKAGEIVGIGNPEATARAAVALLSDANAWQRAQRAGIERVSRYYNEEQMLARYRDIYQKATA